MAARFPELPDERRSAGALSWDFHLPDDFRFFDGHFPGNPILPGVVELDWMVEAARRLLEKTDTPVRLANLKFHHPVKPGSRIRVEASADNENGANGSVHADNTLCASVRIRFP